MDKLISDRAQVEISGRVLDILGSYVIDFWQSEPRYQHQNFAERRYNTIKLLISFLLNLTGTPAYCWLLVLCYMCFYCESHYNRIIELENANRKVDRFYSRHQLIIALSFLGTNVS